MNRVLLIVVALALWTGVAFGVGYKLRDGRADASNAGQQTQQQQARAEQSEQARATDNANTQASSQVQQQRADSHAESAAQFNSIEKRVDEYVQANPVPAGCVLGDDGLRAWREANAGKSTPDPRPENPGGPADAPPAGDSRSGER